MKMFYWVRSVEENGLKFEERPEPKCAFAFLTELSTLGKLV